MIQISFFKFWIYGNNHQSPAISVIWWCSFYLILIEIRPYRICIFFIPKDAKKVSVRVCTCPPVREVCPNHEVVVFQPQTATPPHIVSTTIVTFKLAHPPQLFYCLSEYFKRSVCVWVLHSFILKCVRVFWPFFVLTLLIILFHNTLVTSLFTPTCTPIAPPYPLPNISGGPVLNHMYTVSTSL